MKTTTMLIAAVLLLSLQNTNAQKTVERWAIFEYSLNGPSTGNPYKEVDLKATFTHNSGSTKEVMGFYAGSGVYKVRFMPDALGVWEFQIFSNNKKLNGKKGKFECLSPGDGNHGIVRAKGLHFEYSDGTPYYPFGTTSYAWTHQGDSLGDITVQTLSTSPFNKIRMGLFPKRYRHNFNEPEYFAFQGEKGAFDFTRFNPAYWDNLERRIRQLMELGIEADLILFHPYDGWGFRSMPDEVDDFYLKYATARLSAFRNVWWSLANEYHLMKDKTPEDWDRFGKVVRENDPYDHLISVHNHPHQEFDWSKDWVTHISIQTHDMVHVNDLKEKLQKPAINDECGYEGNLQSEWGNLSAEEIVHRNWTALVHGVYVTHGETFADERDIIWWAKGGRLKGKSVERIGFLRHIVEDLNVNLDYNKPEGWGKNVSGGSFDTGMLVYFGNHQPSTWDFDFPEGNYRLELIDPWNMEIKVLKETCSGKHVIQLPGKPRLALRIVKLP